MALSTATAQTGELSGKIVDENGEAMPYANVVLLSLPDSTFVQGALTDEQGEYHIATTRTDGLVKVSSIGYETLFIGYQEAAGKTVQMKEDTKILDEVVVKSTLPKTRVKGDAMRTLVDGSILEKAGTASDMLSKIPSLEAERGGGVKVFGRGDAEVYINGRKVQDINELSRLRADQIQYVDVVQNPGARYAASTKAVVRIQLKKAQGDGFSFQDYAQGMYEYGHTLANNIDLNYRTGGLDITASFWTGRYGHAKSLQKNDLTYYVGSDRYEGHSTQDSKKMWKGWSPQLQVNYMANENHSFGAFYKFDRHPDGDHSGPFNTDNYKNGEYIERSESYISGNDSFRKHIFNAYYNGKVGKLSIDWNLDGLFDNTNDNNKTSEVLTTAAGDKSTHDIENTTKSSNNFWATKLVLSYPVWKGNLSVGGEYSHNHRTDAYSFTTAEMLPVKATDTEINESATAGFVEYGRSFGKLYAQAGLRYEYLKNDYYDFGVRQDEMCRSYGDWFPTASLSMPIGQVQLSLSYRQDIQRPNYANLTSSTVYINRYTYQSGNPYLKPTYTHSLVFNAAYQWMNLNVNYSRTKDNVTMATEPYPGVSDPLVSLIRPINGGNDYNRLTISPSIRPTIGRWHPMWALNVLMQNYKTPTADGTTVTLDHPFASFVWNNDVELPHGLRLNAMLLFSSKGDYDNMRIRRNQFSMHLGVQYDVNLRRLGQLNIDLRCYDPFESNKSSVMIYGMRDITSVNPPRRCFLLDLTWKFNEARSKYRGSGAGDKQKARM